MRHLKKGKKFHRKKGQRKALVKGLLYNLIMREKMKTTEVKAKALRPMIEKLITIGKKQTTASYRILLRRLQKTAAQKLFYTIAPRYTGKRGGYVRITKMAKQRVHDGSKMAVIEFI